VKARLDRGEKLVLIDVREPWEHQVCKIEGATLIPLGWARWPRVCKCFPMWTK